MPKDNGVYVGHMLDTCDKILGKVQGKSHDDYERDENLRLALAHLVQVVGEAARRVSKEFCDAHPDIPWRQIVGMRHFIVHDYMNVDEERLWDTVTNDIPALRAQLAALKV